MPTDCGNYLNKSDCKAQINIIGTNYGISAPTLQSYYKGPVVITMQDMKNLSQSTAIAIYRSNYWNTIKGDQIDNQSIAETLFDAAVNQHGGPNGAIKMMQKILHSRDPIVIPDGKIGIRTLSILNNNSDKTLFDQFQLARKQAYISYNNPKFIKGWINRLNSFKFKPTIAQPISPPKKTDTGSPIMFA